jgi:molecular chaperone GrpE (heat shock protein)
MEEELKKKNEDIETLEEEKKEIKKEKHNKKEDKKEKEIEELKKKNEELLNKILYSQAEFANYKNCPFLCCKFSSLL